MKIGIEEDFEHYKNYEKCISDWEYLMIDHHGQVDLTIALEASIKLQHSGLYSSKVEKVIYDAILEKLRADGRFISNGCDSIHIPSADVQILKLIEYHQKMSEHEIFTPISINDNDPVRNADLYKRAYANWCTSKHERPDFD